MHYYSTPEYTRYLLRDAISRCTSPEERRNPYAPGNPAYRDLKYFYGPYALSPRLVRPTRLRFWVEEIAAPMQRARSSPWS